MASRQPHIILITSDQHRGDCLGIAGHPVQRTPNLDHLAASGAWFRSAYSEAPTCIPARRVILSGQRPATNGMVGFHGGYRWQPGPTIASELRAAGYHTALIGKTHWHPLNARHGFHHMLVANSQRDGNDWSEWLKLHGWHEPLAGKLHGVETNSFNARPSHLPEGLDLTSWAVNEALKLFRKRDPEMPLFLWISVVDPHPPFTPPKVYYDRYIAAADRIPLPVIGDWANDYDTPNIGLNIQPTHMNLPTAWTQRMRAAYYGLINHIDDQIYNVIRGLKSAGMWDDTVLMYSTDHGEMLGDHNLFRKTWPYEPSAHIPFMFRIPDWMDPCSPTIVDEVVGLQDLAPTLLDAASIPIPDSMDGMSLLPFARGERPAWRSYLHGEHNRREGGEESERVPGNQYLTDGRQKFIWFSSDGREQLFDLLADPMELHDLASNGTHADALAMWRTRLISELRDRPEGYVAGGQLVAGRRPFLPDELRPESNPVRS